VPPPPDEQIELATVSRKGRLLLAMLALERRVHGRSELAGRLSPLAAGVDTDVEEVERLLAAGRAEAALDRCRSQLLPGIDDDWVLQRRDDLRDRLTRSLETAAAGAEAGGDVRRGSGRSSWTQRAAW
jgi:hypothetical protein